jgi:uncharacterized protein YgiM (DUF1202 family)
MAKGSTVTIIGSSDDGKWYNVQQGGKTGWGFAQYINKTASAKTASALASTTVPLAGGSVAGVVLAAGGANFNAQPSGAGPVLQWLPAGEPIALGKLTGNWYAATHKTVNGFISKSEVSTVSANLVPYGLAIVTSMNGADLYDTGALTGNIIKHVNKGAKVEVLTIEKYFIEVRIDSGSGETGYLLKDSVWALPAGIALV